MKTGYIAIYDEKNRSAIISGYVKAKIPYTEALSASDFEPKEREVFIFSFDGENLDTICVGERKKRVVTHKYRVQFTNFVDITPPLNIAEVQRNIAKELRTHFIRVTSGEGNRVPEKTWESIISFIKKTRPEISKKIDELFEIKNISLYQGKDLKIESFKSDATTLSLKIAGLDPNRTSFECYNQSGEILQDLPPFLQGLKSYYILEDRMINHDAKMIPDWTSLNVPPQVTARFTDGQKTLTIQNYNREPIESTLGVDLMYYNEFYKSFVLIQYKALKIEKNERVYRLSDLTYKAEYENMQKLQKHLDSFQVADQQITNYRFNRGACYFKLCERELFDLNSNEMIKGMYIPLEYWDSLIMDDSTKGPRSGRFISHANVGRYFNNTQFIELVKEGWIGTTIHESKALEKIIKEVLDAKKSVILSKLTKV